MDGSELVGEDGRPADEDVEHRHTVHDRERQVEVRPAIAVVVCERADDGSGDHALIRHSKLEHAVANTVAIFDAERSRCHIKFGICRSERWRAVAESNRQRGGGACGFAPWSASGFGLPSLFAARVPR